MGGAEESWHKAKKMEKVESEKQISVDPISLSQPHINKFMSCSLPSSASSSPNHKKKKQQLMPLARQRSVALVNLERLRENHLRRSKSCGDGRACQPSVDFDMWSSRKEKMMMMTDDTEKEEETKKEEKFKCGACLFLPGLGKAKTVRARKEVEVDIVVSHRVSLEKFECGSWRSSEDIGAAATATSSLFFDLPVELIRCTSINDAESPVTRGFVFDNHHPKGVLKTCKKSQELSSNSSPRHVRFSTSSPCITPRLNKARDDFSAFLEAQSA